MQIESHPRIARGVSAVSDAKNHCAVDVAGDSAANDSRLHHVTVDNTRAAGVQWGKITQWPVPAHYLTIWIIGLHGKIDFVAGATMGGERTPQPKFNFFKSGRIWRRNIDHGPNGLGWPPTAGQQCRRISVVRADSGLGAKSFSWYGLDIRPINSVCQSVYPVTTFKNGVLGQRKVGGVK